MKQTGPKKTAVLYMRVSTKKQADEGHSLEEQDTQLPEFCRSRSITVLETFTDPGESGRTMDRPGFNAMLQYCRKHRPSHVVVTSLSRFARNVAGQSDALVKLKSYGTTVLSMTEPNVDDTAAGRLALNIFGAYHQYFVDHLAERMASAARSTFEAGRWGRSAPLGYVNQKSGGGGPNIVPDPTRAPLIKRAFELMASGNYKAADVHRIMVAEGLTTRRGKPVPIQTFVQILRSPVYMGFQKSIKYNETKPGLWEPLVDRHTFQSVQMLLDGRKPTTAPYNRNHPEFPLRGTLLCEGCGQPLTGGSAKGRGGKKYRYYWCRTAGCRAVKNTPAEKIEAEFLVLLKELRSCPDFEQAILPELKKVWQSSEPERAALIKQAEDELKEQEELRDRLMPALLKGVIDQQAYATWKQRFDDTCEGYEQYLAELHGKEAMSALFFAFSRNLLTDIGGAWARAEVDKQQMFQKMLFRNGVRYSTKDGILNPDKCCLFSELKGVLEAFTTFGVPDGI